MQTKSNIAQSSLLKSQTFTAKSSATLGSKHGDLWDQMYGLFPEVDEQDISTSTEGLSEFDKIQYVIKQIESFEKRDKVPKTDNDTTFMEKDKMKKEEQEKNEPIQEQRRRTYI